MSPDEICEQYYDKGVKVSIIVEGDMVYLKGDQIGLEFLGKLLLAQSKFLKDDSFHISPKGAGKGLFTIESNAGLHLQRINKA